MKKHWKIFLLIGLIAVIILGIFFGARFMIRLATSGVDTKFGDQGIKTAVSLIELHNVRYGKYPKNLKELKFIGDWDPIALNSVRYYTNRDQSKYFVGPNDDWGWMGDKPGIQLPAEFWQGTGYQSDLHPPLIKTPK